MLIYFAQGWPGDPVAVGLATDDNAEAALDRLWHEGRRPGLARNRSLGPDPLPQAHHCVRLDADGKPVPGSECYLQWSTEGVRRRRMRLLGTLAGSATTLGMVWAALAPHRQHGVTTAMWDVAFFDAGPAESFFAAVSLAMEWPVPMLRPAPVALGLAGRLRRRA